MNRKGGGGGERKTQREKGQGPEETRRTQRQGYTRETKETHVDTETRTTGNKGGICVRRQTKSLKLVVIVLQYSEY